MVLYKPNQNGDAERVGHDTYFKWQMQTPVKDRERVLARHNIIRTRYEGREVVIYLDGNKTLPRGDRKNPVELIATVETRFHPFTGSEYEGAWQTCVFHRDGQEAFCSSTNSREQAIIAHRRHVNAILQKHGSRDLIR